LHINKPKLQPHKIMTTNQYYSFDEFSKSAKEFLFSIMAYYNGSTEERIERTIEFLDDLIFKTQLGLDNPFSNEDRTYYKLAKYSRKILIPELLDGISKLENSDPFDIHEWN